jgi:hypothetical protein
MLGDKLQTYTLYDRVVKKEQQTLQETLQSLGKEKPINRNTYKRRTAGAYNNLQTTSDEVL